MQKLFGTDQNIKSANQLIKGLLTKSIYNRLKSLVSKEMPQMSDSDRTFLEYYFTEENSKLRDLTGFELQ